MGQREILKFLEKKKLATMKEISEGTGVTVYAIWQSLRRMEGLDVEKIAISKKSKCYAWIIKGDEESKNKLLGYPENE